MGGNVVIPSFAVGRTQELLYFIREIKEQNLVKSVPDFPVCVWTPPWPGEATTHLLRRSARLSGRGGASALVQGGAHMFNFPGLHHDGDAARSPEL